MQRVDASLTQTAEIRPPREVRLRPKVMVVTLNWNTSEETIECLESLRKVNYSSFELTIVDNGSDDGSLVNLRAFLAQTGGIRIRTDIVQWNDEPIAYEVFQIPMEDPQRADLVVLLVASTTNRGFPGGNNIGIRLAKVRSADYAILLNNDTVVDASFMESLVSVASRDAIVGIAGSKVYYYDHPNLIQTVGGTIHWRTGRFRNIGFEVDHGQYDEQTERDFVFATSMLVRMKVFEAVGTLDEFFVFGIEEFDLCTRAKKAGYKVVYVPASRIWHKAGRSAAKLVTHPETLEMIKKNRGFLGLKYEVAFFGKHLGFPRAALPMTFRVCFVLAGAVQEMMLARIGRTSFTRESPLGGVARLHRLELTQILDKIRSKRTRR